jgi:predicted nucleic-acid-binding Zn-ribbon protein
MEQLNPYKPSIRNLPCPKCDNPPPHEWVAWGSYLDKDLNCKKCGYTIDIWNC